MKKRLGKKWADRLGVLFGVLFWLAVWQLVSMKIGNHILVASPLQAVRTFFGMLVSVEVWRAVGSSFVKIALGFVLGVTIGSLFAVLAATVRVVRYVVTPVLRLVKAVPVASFIILALLWVSSKHLSVLISFLMVLPVIYTNVLRGIVSTDKELCEMAAVFRLGFGKRLRYIYLPAVLPYFVSACSVGLGFCFKSGIAAEIIGLPDNSIGEKLYEAKLYLMTPELFAWTGMIVIISVCFERVVMFAIRRAAYVLCGYGRKTAKENEVTEQKRDMEKKITENVVSDSRMTDMVDNKVVTENWQIPKTEMTESNRTESAVAEHVQAAGTAKMVWENPEGGVLCGNRLAESGSKSGAPEEKTVLAKAATEEETVTTAGDTGTNQQETVTLEKRTFARDAFKLARLAREQGREAGMRGQEAGEQGKIAEIQGEFAGKQGELAAEQGQEATKYGKRAEEQGKLAGERGRAFHAGSENYVTPRAELMENDATRETEEKEENAAFLRDFPEEQFAGEGGTAKEYGLSDVSKSFDGKPVLRHFTLSLPVGVTALMGPSGCGKSTVGKLFLSLLAPEEGTVTAPKECAAVFQEDRLCMEFDAVTNVAMVCRDRVRAEQALSEVGLGGLLGKPVSEFSGGMKRRVAIVRALLADAGLVVLDEPFTGLDETGRTRMMEWVKRNSSGKNVLLITHHAEEAQNLAQKVVSVQL